MSRSAVATRLPMTAGRPFIELARYCMLDHPVDLPLTSCAHPRAVLPVMVTLVPSLRTLITRWERPGPLRRLSAVVVTLTVPAPILLGGGRSFPLVRYLLAT